MHFPSMNSSMIRKGTAMKKTRIYLRIVSLFLVCAVTLPMTGCSMTVQAKDLMDGITPNEVRSPEDLSAQNALATDLALRLMAASEKSGENTLISPLSVLCALAMTMNGAEGETLRQMEAVLGMTPEEANLYLYSYLKSLPLDEKNQLNLANSIWFTDDGHFTVKRDFLQTNADYYGADIFEAPFDAGTCKEINHWVKGKTDGMIPEILDRIPPEAVMYLVNALAFEAEWAVTYENDQVKSGEFTKEDGTRQDAKFMYGSESTYLEDEKATGFMKYYSGCKYAFVAMLPNEGVSVSDYIASLDGETLHALLSAPQYTPVLSAIPKFQTAYTTEMSAILGELGMPEAFDPDNAEFASLGASAEGNLYISRVLHKTFISVAEQGTKAGAATVIGIANKGAAPDPETPKQVYLDRPFVYMLVDCENHIPFFIGTMMDMKG